MNYRGSIANMFVSALKKHPEKEVGEILYSFLCKGKLRKHYYEASDEEIYNSLERFVLEEEWDEPFDDHGFLMWVKKVAE